MSNNEEVLSDQTTEASIDEAVDVAEEVVENDIEQLLKERDEFKDIALRLQADFENYKKRVATNMADDIQRATGRLAESLLPVLDACEAAINHGSEGAQLIFNSLKETLAKEGLIAFDLLNKPFNPENSEAVMHEEGDDGEPVVVEILRAGYEWKGRVLRAAMVKVRG